MKLPRTAAEVLGKHVVLEVECIDRMYLNVYVPDLQRELGVVSFFRYHRGLPFASGALMAPMTEAFVAKIQAFAERHSISVVSFEKGQRKDDVAREYRERFAEAEGVYLLGKAQEKARVWRTESRRNPETGARYPWLAWSTAMVNKYYFYAVDRDFGPFFLKFCSYFPYTAKLPGASQRATPAVVEGGCAAAARCRGARLRDRLRTTHGVGARPEVPAADLPPRHRLERSFLGRPPDGRLRRHLGGPADTPVTTRPGSNHGRWACRTLTSSRSHAAASWRWH